jgi:hypothetical protein
LPAPDGLSKAAGYYGKAGYSCQQGRGLSQRPAAVPDRRLPGGFR